MNDDIEKKLEVETQESASSQTSKEFVKSPEEKRLVKKIDKAFVPFICVVLFLQVYITLKFYIFIYPILT
jgi:hypothetical protein